MIGVLGDLWGPPGPCPLPTQVAQEAFDGFGGINNAVASRGDISLLSSAEPSGMPQRKRLQPAGAAGDTHLQVKGKGTVLVCLVLKEKEDSPLLPDVVQDGCAPWDGAGSCGPRR